MDEFLIREEKRLFKKYGVSDLDAVLAMQYKILKDEYKSQNYLSR